MSALPGHSDDVVLRRTPVHVDHFAYWRNERWAYCTPGGVDLPLHSIVLPVSDFPLSMRATIETGSVFFARVNLRAGRSWECVLADIEEGWADIGALHFEAGTDA